MSIRIYRRLRGEAARRDAEACCRGAVDEVRPLRRRAVPYRLKQVIFSPFSARTAGGVCFVNPLLPAAYPSDKLSPVLLRDKETPDFKSANLTR